MAVPGRTCAGVDGPAERFTPRHSSGGGLDSLSGPNGDINVPLRVVLRYRSMSGVANAVAAGTAQLDYSRRIPSTPIRVSACSARESLRDESMSPIVKYFLHFWETFTSGKHHISGSGVVRSRCTS
jgi:hypothetical protein